MAAQGDKMTVPQWAVDLITDLRSRLLLHEWEIRTRIDRIIDGEPDVNGMAESQADISTATISLRSDIEDTKQWRQDVTHEVLHVRHARVDAAVDDIISELPFEKQVLAQKSYRRAMESYTQTMAFAINELLMEVSNGQKNRAYDNRAIHIDDSMWRSRGDEAGGIAINSDDGNPINAG